MAEETSLSNEECIARMDAWLERQAEANAQAYPARKRSDRRQTATTRGGRRQTATTRRKLKEKQRAHHASRALEGEVSPLRRARLERGLTLDDAAAAALVSARSFRRAETNPAAVSPLTLARVAAAMQLPPSELLPAD